MIRIKGKNTIEMIKALTDLENIKVGNNIRTLVVKKGANVILKNGLNAQEREQGTLGAQGIAAFIEDKEYCPECKNKMKLAKNQKGTFYLRCSNKSCKHMEFLSSELMNWYISSKNVKCPKGDGGSLQGIVGKFGPCIKCDRGHFLKVDEI